MDFDASPARSISLSLGTLAIGASGDPLSHGNYRSPQRRGSAELRQKQREQQEQERQRLGAAGRARCRSVAATGDRSSQPVRGVAGRSERMAQSGMSVQEMRKVMTGFNHQMKDGVSDASREQLKRQMNSLRDSEVLAQ